MEDPAASRIPGTEGQNFDWRIYADATSAGLSNLVPLPLVDIVFEIIFRRRMPGTIAKARGREMAPEIRRSLGRALDSSLSLEGCFKLFFMVVRSILRRIWRKIIYILAIKDAATALSEYWHRAYLIDHMVVAGHLDPGVDAELALKVFDRTLHEVDTSPLMGLARQTVANAHHVLRILSRARRTGAAEVTRSLGKVLSSHWEAAAASLEGVGQLYNQLYWQELEIRSQSDQTSETHGPAD